MLPETCLQLTLKDRKQLWQALFEGLKTQNIDIPSKQLANLLNVIEAEAFKQLNTIGYKNFFRWILLIFRFFKKRLLFRRLRFNLIGKKTSLLKRLLDGSVKPEQVPKMSSLEMLDHVPEERLCSIQAGTPLTFSWRRPFY